MLGSAPVRRLLVFATALSLWLGTAGVAPARAAGETPTADTARLVSVAAEAPAASGSHGPVQFSATVDYQLQTTPRAFFLIFVFEDSSTSATTDSSKGTWVSAGAGQLHLATTYQPTAGAHSLTLIVGLFRDAKTLLAWSRTEPFSLAPLPGEQFFAKALAARQGGNYAEAVSDLSSAIELAPTVGTFYCWRADTRVHLGEYDAAIADYSRALDLLPNDRSCRVGRGVAYLWSGNQQQAIADLTKVIDQGSEPDRWTIWARRARGVANANLGNFAGAIADYRAYLSLAPNVPDRAEIGNWISILQSAESETPSGGGTRNLE